MRDRPFGREDLIEIISRMPLARKASSGQAGAVRKEASQ